MSDDMKLGFEFTPKVKEFVNDTKTSDFEIDQAISSSSFEDSSVGKLARFDNDWSGGDDGGRFDFDTFDDSGLF